MKPVLVLLGRPNVGKSTLFNRLTGTRDALVADQPGLTRDRHYGGGAQDGREFLVVDTAGFDPTAKDGISHEMSRQAEAAIAEADALVFVVDGRAGLTAHDEEIAAYLRRVGRNIFVAVNKAEGMRREMANSEFFALGLGDPLAISSAHGDGVRALIAEVLASVPVTDAPEAEHLPEGSAGPSIAVAGRPNVGKSTLVNALLGEERVIAYDQPGTTRDAISIDFIHKGRQCALVDTAGVRRRAKVSEAVEKFSVIKTLQAVEKANVCILLLDASQEVSDQDARLAGFMLEAGRAVVVAVNKWDAVDAYRREQVKANIQRKLPFLSFAKFHYISARNGQGVDGVMKSVFAAYTAATARLATPKLTRILQAALLKQAPPRKGSFRPRMRYAHQGGSNPPIVVVHGSTLDAVPDSYRRYLEKTFTEAFGLQGTPLRIQFKSTKNPYADKS